MQNKKVYCRCGCGRETLIGKNSHLPNKYIIGHHPVWNKGIPCSSETRAKISTKQKGRKLSEKTKRKMSKSRMGHPGYTKGLHWSKESNLERSKKLLGRTSPMKGRKHSRRTKDLIGLSQTGEKHHNWLGGKSFEIYPREFNKFLKSKIRERDNYICQRCGIPEIECDRKLDIHHKDSDKKNNNINNLISLCRSCHIKTHFNKDMKDNTAKTDEIKTNTQLPTQ